MSHSTIDTQLAVAAEDLSDAQRGLQQTLDYLREQGQPWAFSDVQSIVEDPDVIGKIGDLQIRIDLAEALLERARTLDGLLEQRLIASTEAVIASADALLAVDNVQHELTGQRQSLPSQAGREPLRWHYQVLGNHRLNGVAPPQLQE
ncbi:acyl-CoA dehydrogenase [Pseudomonas viridiflava]|uniref:acyl-CoA dehydrogenase n=1 Tax=Pseudomonas viridiflava TaxID=33069 RepID=UPI000F01B37B|nr:acyl-CoA dehydrogenase [Pseudomonas viridiflava]